MVGYTDAARTRHDFGIGGCANPFGGQICRCGQVSACGVYTNNAAKMPVLRSEPVKELVSVGSADPKTGEHAHVALTENFFNAGHLGVDRSLG